MEDSKETTRPVETLRKRGISASIFAFTPKAADRDTPFHKVVLKRRYRDGDEYRSTEFLGRDDLPVASYLLSKAWERIMEREEERRKKSADK